VKGAEVAALIDTGLGAVELGAGFFKVGKLGFEFAKIGTKAGFESAARFFGRGGSNSR